MTGGSAIPRSPIKRQTGIRRHERKAQDSSRRRAASDGSGEPRTVLSRSPASDRPPAAEVGNGLRSACS